MSSTLPIAYIELNCWHLFTRKFCDPSESDFLHFFPYKKLLVQRFSFAMSAIQPTTSMFFIFIYIWILFFSFAAHQSSSASSSLPCRVGHKLRFSNLPYCAFTFINIAILHVVDANQQYKQNLRDFLYRFLRFSRSPHVLSCSMFPSDVERKKTAWIEIQTQISSHFLSPSVPPSSSSLLFFFPSLCLCVPASPPPPPRTVPLSKLGTFINFFVHLCFGCCFVVSTRCVVRITCSCLVCYIELILCAKYPAHLVNCSTILGQISLSYTADKINFSVSIQLHRRSIYRNDVLRLCPTFCIECKHLLFLHVCVAVI